METPAYMPGRAPVAETPGFIPGASAGCGNPGIYPRGERRLRKPRDLSPGRAPVAETPGFIPGSASCRAKPRVSTRVPASHPVMVALAVQIGLRLGHVHIAQAAHEVARTPE